MKDLKHYFTENVKAAESNNDETREVTKEPANAKASIEETKEIPSPATKRKRGRVKIKISQMNDVGRVCDIVESKNDLIDKTPSPFTGRDVKVDETTTNDTPKRSISVPRQTGQKGLIKAATRRASNQSESEEKNVGDENDNSISKLDNKTGESMARVNGRAVLMENAAAPCMEIPPGEREESNAFRVLMTRKKSVQYTAPANMGAEEEETAAKIREENRKKLKQNKDKLVALADKKGYTKRKVGEMEEAEKIERRLEKRAKVFKMNGKKEMEEGSPPLSGRRSIVPGNLHSYFSKATPEQKEKELTAVSTLVVTAEVHSSDCIIAEKGRETGEAKTAAKTTVETREAMATVNDIQVVGSENLNSQDTNEEGPSSRSRKKKPRWSLRINLQCNDNGERTDRVIENDDNILTGRRESKPRKSKVKLTNYEDKEGSESDASNAKITKKRKSSPILQKTKIPLSKAGIVAPNLEDEMLPIIVDIVESKKTEVLQIEESEFVDVTIVKRQTNEKLAPLFVKKQKPDPAAMEARRLFLHSLPSENENQRKERKIPIVGTPILPFPNISHVTQLCGDSNIEAVPLKTKFPIRDKISYVPSYHLNDFESVNSLKNESAKKSQHFVELTKGNVEEVLSEIESRCSDAREIWKSISTTANNGTVRRKSPKRKGKKRKSSEKKINDVTSEDKIDHDGIWTHKYRPMSSREIVGNEDAARKLHAWLDGWKIPLRKEDSSSGDEFYSSDCSNVADNNQVAVLLGPHGSGKTASVYAIAEELGYRVIEVNASSKRAGKKLLKELEEATKSHRIKKSVATSLLPIPRAKKAIPQNSLILVEDVDLIFEEDEGFISATCQLASNTKRPIVMTGRDTCSHLNRMAPQQLRIYYQTTVGSRVSALLELITLAESGYRLPRSCLDRLLQNGDLRKALLQLQYLLLSGQPIASEVPTNFHRSLWQDMRYCLYKPAIRATKKPSKKKLSNSEKPSSPPNDKLVVRNLANDLESLSFLSTLIEIDDPALDVTSLKFEPSISLDENTHSYSSLNNTTTEIAKWLRDRVIDRNGANEPGEIDSQIVRQLSLKKELNTGVNLALSQVSPQTLDGRVITLDYLPSLRAICRAEDTRVTTNNKRGNRFFHYLQNLRLPSTSTRPNILAAACKIMKEKNSES